MKITNKMTNEPNIRKGVNGQRDIDGRTERVDFIELSC